ncbi:hypothetical protein EJB05_08683, partial [Eragrostis curvula]
MHGQLFVASSLQQKQQQLAADKMKMSMLLVTLLLAFVALFSSPSEAIHEPKTKTFLSPPFDLRPGDVSNKWYYDIDFPRGHIALKSFNGEVVDENGAPVPLHETYLHHWLVVPYYAAKGRDDDVLPRTNSGPCKDSLGQYFGLGAETRRTVTRVPDPYGIEVGDAPAGYEERWYVNVHAIDTRGAADGLGCTECRCDLYNVTIDERGRGIQDGYAGGTHCCYDQTRCRLKEGFTGGELMRKLYLRYTVEWVDWSDAVVPVRIYIFDVTDNALAEGGPKPDCKIEYTVEECSSENRARNQCVDVKETKEVVTHGGDIVYAVAHQHRGGIGSSLYGQDGRVLCASKPIYGTGQEVGNEVSYVVGMSTCYPPPGTVTVRNGEVLTVVSNYSNERQHTGVMGHFYILVADQERNKKPSSRCFSLPVSLRVASVTDTADGRLRRGTHCCYDRTSCRLKEGFGGGELTWKLFLRYTVSWLDWSDAPVRIYIFGVTDHALAEGRPKPVLQEYTMEECSSENRARNYCVDVKETKEVVPHGGDIVYAVAHQHRGGIGYSLYGQDGRLLCASKPIYGTGQEIGNEASYVVGMSTCYPPPGTVTVRNGEALTVVSNYSNERQHTGVMGHFYILVADQERNKKPSSRCFSLQVSCELASI